MSELTLNEHLARLDWLVGRTWTGEFQGSTPERPMIDVMRCERALNGNAIRILHSVNGGEYGGETIMMWDPAAGELMYYYFTTSGFYTRGSMVAGDGHYTAHETVTGNEAGITEVKSKSHLTPDGKMRVQSQYFKEQSWVEGHEVVYEASSDEVVFR